LVAFACSGKDNSAPQRLCTPGAYVFCRCQNRDEGTKLCNPDGNSFKDCGPCDGTAPTGGGASDGLGEHGHSSADDPDTPSSSSSSSSHPNKPADAGADVRQVPGSDDGGPSHGTPTSGPTNPPSNPPNNAPHCKPLTNSAPKVTVQQIADDWPTPVGGTVKDGLYVQTWVVSYTGANGDQGGVDASESRQMIEITGDTGRYVFADDGHDDQTGGFRIAYDSGKATISYECPAGAPRTFRYDAIGDDLALYDTKVARFFTRQSGGSK
jgi:hypothetical protein